MKQRLSVLAMTAGAVLGIAACIDDHRSGLELLGNGDNGSKGDGIEPVVVLHGGRFEPLMVTPADPTGAGEIAHDSAAALCNSLRYAGHDDWKLPPEQVLADLGSRDLASLAGFGDVTVWSDFAFVGFRDFGGGVGFAEGQAAAMALETRRWEVSHFDPRTPASGSVNHAICVRSDVPLPDYNRCYSLPRLAMCICIGGYLVHDFTCN